MYSINYFKISLKSSKRTFFNVINLNLRVVTTFSDEINAGLFMEFKKRKQKFRFSSKKSARWFKKRVVVFGSGNHGKGEQEDGDGIHDTHQLDPDTQVWYT